MNFRPICKEDALQIIQEAKWVSARDFDELEVCRQDDSRCSIWFCGEEARVGELDKSPAELKADLATARMFLEELSKDDSLWGSRAKNVLEAIDR